MFARLLSIGVLIFISSVACANERLAIQFTLMLDEALIHKGSILVSPKISGWNKGLKKSYLKLRCKELPDGSIEKSLSTVDLFDGLQLTQQKINDSIELNVVLSNVKPRLLEIKKLAKNECVDLSPVVTKTTEKYNFVATKGTKEPQLFGTSMIFKANIL